MSTLIRRAEAGPFVRSEPGIYIRDLGVDGVSDGDYSLLVIRIEPQGARVENLHRHDEGFSLAYVLKGWLEVEFAEIGWQHLEPGTLVPAFNAPTHREVDAGDELELLLLVSAKNLADYEHEKIVLQRAGDASCAAAASDTAHVRDFGLGALTGGRLSGRAVHAMPGVKLDGVQPAACGFNFIYLARGWLEAEIGASGRVRLEPGALVADRTRIVLTLIDHSDDLLLIEIATPHPGRRPTAA